jgi:hypothetical protein
MKLIKDISTLADGQSADMAGIATLIAFCMGVGAVGYVFIDIRPDDVDDVLKVLSGFGQYFGMIITAGSAGKLLNNKAEANSE